MNIKKYGLAVLIAGSFFSSNLYAQLIDLEDKKVVAANGFEYGYLIKNEQTKAIKGDEYSRFEIILFITNKTGCTKLYADREKSMITNNDGNKLAIFNCLNATGKRLTSKTANIEAKPFYVSAKVKIAEKEETKNAKVGYIFRNGETLRNNIVVLLPLKERPKISCSINTLPEL